jgi:hypothetical protein
MPPLQPTHLTPSQATTSRLLRPNGGGYPIYQLLKSARWKGPTASNPCKTSFFPEGHEVPHKLPVSVADRGRRNWHYHTCNIFRLHGHAAILGRQRTPFHVLPSIGLARRGSFQTIKIFRHLAPVHNELDFSVVINTPYLNVLNQNLLASFRCLEHDARSRQQFVQTTLFHILYWLDTGLGQSALKSYLVRAGHRYMECQEKAGVTAAPAMCTILSAT